MLGLSIPHALALLAQLTLLFGVPIICWLRMRQEPPAVRLAFAVGLVALGLAVVAIFLERDSDLLLLAAGVTFGLLGLRSR